MNEGQWKARRSEGDQLVLIVVGAGLVLIVLLIVGFAMFRWLQPETFRNNRGAALAPTQVTLEDFEPFGASFTDVAEEAGVNKVQASGAKGERLLPETMGSGVALGDLDGDGDSDLLLLSYGSTPALYRNDSPMGGPIRFTDVTPGSGLESIEHSTTAGLGDFDGDGLIDIYMGRVGPDQLLRNTGEFQFELNRELGDGWTSAVGFGDIDNDHDLDLVVASYVVWSPEIDREVDYTLDGIGRAYGPPTGFKATNLALHVNDGSGGFTEESEERGLRVLRDDRDVPVMKALGLLLEDLDKYSDLSTGIDIVVANDTTGNRLFINDGSGHFTEAGIEAGVAYDLDGKSTGAMGIDRTHFGYRGSLLVIGNFANEPSSVYIDDSSPRNSVQSGIPVPVFDESGSTSGVGPATRNSLTFGTLLFDADLDGETDLLQVNGHIEPEIGRVQEGQTYPQRAQLFRGTGDRPMFLEVPAEQLGDLSEPIVGRAAAHSDLDGDGDIDLVISRVDEVPLIMRNDLVLPEGRKAVKIRLVGAGKNPDAYGAKVRVEYRMGGSKQEWMVSPTRSYMSQSDVVHVVPVDAMKTIASIQVWFPGGMHVTVHSPSVKDGEIVVYEPHSGRPSN